MIDLEALGLRPNAVVPSIGAVFFDPNSDALGPQFHRICKDLEEQQARGRVIDADTMLWWMNQDKSARDASFHDTSRMGLTQGVLEELASFLRGSDNGQVRVWGNGSDFDNVLLASLYQSYGMNAPWYFRNNRCFRTYRNLPFAPRAAAREGTHHNPLDDAIHQARHHQAITAAMSAIRVAA
jgi:hypothetical protein